MNEETSIRSVIKQLRRLPLDEMVIVVNGSNDQSFHLIRNHSNATIIHYPDPIGHDVGRAIGARITNADILLFLDGDFSIPAEHVVPFIEAVGDGLDVALNNISPYIGNFSARDEVTIVKQFLNVTMGRADLQANSLTAIPHALSKKAVQSIHYTNLMVPPKALVAAIINNLRIGCPASVNVFIPNKIRTNNIGKTNRVSEMIIGDHIEALQEAMEARGARLSFKDGMRNREFAGVSNH
jgi:glycosyltransferase involved in cell wall biosynthesis